MSANSEVLADAEEQGQHMEQSGAVLELPHTVNRKAIQGVRGAGKVEGVQEKACKRHR